MRKSSWEKKEERLLVDMINITCNKITGRINWTLMRPIGSHSLAALQSRWSQNLKARYKWDGESYVLRQSKKTNASTPTKREERSKKTPQIKRVKISRSFLWGAIKFERYE